MSVGAKLLVGEAADDVWMTFEAETRDGFPELRAGVALAPSLRWCEQLSQQLCGVKYVICSAMKIQLHSQVVDDASSKLPLA
jgi:hypothetical protein